MLVGLILNANDSGAEGLTARQAKVARPFGVSAQTEVQTNDCEWRNTRVVYVRILMVVLQ